MTAVRLLASPALPRLLCAAAWLALGAAAAAQEPAKKEPEPAELPGKEQPVAPGKVDVRPRAGDEEIARRLENILQATGWFEEPAVAVDEGVAFLNGKTESEQYKKWAGDLARNTQDVVAVVNQIDVAVPSPWDVQPALAGLSDLGRDFIAALPFVVFGLVILPLAFFAAVAATWLARTLLRGRVGVGLLLEVIARAVGLLVFLLGLYIVLRVAGLTRLAVTVLGGTGLLGLIIGIAFRDITENFLASILLSVQRPFRSGDLVEIDKVTGFVQQLNVRTTVLMTLDGNQVQIPNSTVYKSNICNFTSNPNRRESFTVGVGYEVVITDAQQAALEVLAEHPAVLKNPEPWVLVDGLGPATVNLRVYFWLDGSQHSWLKVRSSVIRLVKRAFQERGISMPDDAREVIFPQGVPVHMLDGRPPEEGQARPPAVARALEPRVVSTEAEAGLQTEKGQIEEQARQSRLPESGENLLQPGDGAAGAATR